MLKQKIKVIEEFSSGDEVKEKIKNSKSKKEVRRTSQKTCRSSACLVN